MVGSNDSTRVIEQYSALPYPDGVSWPKPIGTLPRGVGSQCLAATVGTAHALTSQMRIVGSLI
jgi:hypothetical protein